MPDDRPSPKPTPKTDPPPPPPPPFRPDESLIDYSKKGLDSPREERR